MNTNGFSKKCKAI